MKLLIIAVMASVLAGCVGYVQDRGSYYERDGYYNSFWYGTERYERPRHFDHDRRGNRSPHSVGPIHNNPHGHFGPPARRNHGGYFGSPSRGSRGGHFGSPSRGNHSGHSGPPSREGRGHRPF